MLSLHIAPISRICARLYSRIIAVTVTDGVPFEVSVAVVGGEGVDDMRAVVVDAAAAVGLCKVPCQHEATLIKQTHTITQIC